VNAPTLWDATDGPPGADDDRTVLQPSSGGGNALAPGHRLQEFVIEGLVGEGGFSIVYLARDTRLGRRVALKEYMPSTLATRSASHEVAARSERVRDTFHLGLRSFVNEAQLLASFDHPSLVKVYRFWEQGGTAYMVMPYYEGPTLKSWLTQAVSAPDEAWLRALLASLLDALELIHDDHCWHRDIAPDNILLLTQHGANPLHASSLRPLLLDFGAARRVIGDATHALTAILKPGYAPVEQYAESSSMKQGPWTDVYALCAVLYAGVTGHAPAPSVGRVISDELVPAVQAGAGRYSQRFLAAIDAGLAVRPERRPADMKALRRLFEAGAEREPSAAQTVVMPAAAHDEATIIASPSLRTLFDAPPWRDAALRADIDEKRAPPATPKSAPRRDVLWLAAGLMTIAATAALWWWLREGPTDAPTVASDPPAPISAAAGGNSPARPSFSVLAALQDIVARSDPQLSVTASADKTTLTIGRDRLQFRLSSSEAGYLYLYFSGTDRAQVHLLFPNQIDKNNRIEAHQPLVLPRHGWHIGAAGPAGTNHIVAVVSRRPRDLSSAGLLRSADELAEFDLALAEQRWSQAQGTTGLFVGSAICDAGVACDEAYGATMLQIEEVEAAPRSQPVVTKP
jgi:serine/threonine protein kinase